VFGFPKRRGAEGSKSSPRKLQSASGRAAKFGSEGSDAGYPGPKGQVRKEKHNAFGNKCGRQLANDEGRCDRVKGHSGAHSDAHMRKYGSA
jgi:hypothetical protein